MNLIYKYNNFTGLVSNYNYSGREKNKKLNFISVLLVNKIDVLCEFDY